MNKFMPYTMPIISILVIMGFVFLDPTVTGFFVKEDDLIGAKITVSTTEEIVIPPEAVVEVGLDSVSREIRFSEFVERSGGDFKLVEGGYTGNYNYYLRTEDLGFNDLEAGQVLRVRVYSGEWVISESEAVVPSR